MGTIPKRVKQWPFPEKKKIKDGVVGDYLELLYVALQSDGVLKLRDYSNLYDTIMESVLEVYIFEEDGNSDLQPRIVEDTFHNDPLFEYDSNNDIQPKDYLYGDSEITIGG